MTTPEMNDPSGELDRLLSDLPADLPLDEQKFAEDLMRQAKSNPPDSRFVEDLSNRLWLRHPANKPSMFKLQNFWLAFAGGAAVFWRKDPSEVDTVCCHISGGAGSNDCPNGTTISTAAWSLQRAGQCESERTIS
jgi:hypothetical protein